MDRKMGRFFGMVAALLVAGVTHLAAQDTAAILHAVVAETEGKVEYKDVGAAWKTLRVGTVVAEGSVISTGFKSTVTLKLGEDTLMVKPVTRLSLQELVKTEGGTRTKLFLTVGRVKAEVNPTKRANVDFSIKSATATASVRGTGFETDGVNLVVTHGLVEMQNNWGSFRKVGGGEYARIQNDNSVAMPVAVEPSKGLERLDEIAAQTILDHRSGGISSVIQVPAQSGNITMAFQ